MKFANHYQLSMKQSELKSLLVFINFHSVPKCPRDRIGTVKCDSSDGRSSSAVSRPFQRNSKKRLSPKVSEYFSSQSV
ncbi:hypothetical protein AVEN_160524-1, partial [Araneus ventricosus]